MKKMAIGISGLLLIGLIGVAVRLFASQATANTENGLSPFTAIPLNEGRYIGLLAPGESQWYKLTRKDGAFQEQVDLTLFFTPDDGNRAHWVNFQIYPADQIENWYQGDASGMQNLGAGGVVSRDGNPVTGELLWSGWVVSNETYYVQVSNGSEINIDYWLFTGDVIAAELGQPTESPSPAEMAVATDPSEDDGRLLPLASELQSTQSNPTESVGSNPTESVGSNPTESVGSNPTESVGSNSTEQTWDIPPGTPTRLVIPSIGLDSQIVSVGWEPIVIEGHTYKRWSTADNLVGWHNLSAKLGQIGNTVLNGHSDVSAEVFRNLSDVRIGDEIIVFSGNEYYRYTVTEMTSVKEKGVSLGERIENARWIAATQDERLTLVTCANPGASHRLIVVARPLTN